MSTRRPRIKASANLALASKRKPRPSTDVVEATKVIKEVQKVEPIDEPEEDPVEDDIPETPSTAIPIETITSIPPTLDSPEIVNGDPGGHLKPFADAFKYPQNPDYKRPSAVVAIEENSASDFEDNILHMDLQKSPGFPMSPTKSRQRIRPTPIFGQRRNSFVGTSPSPHTEDETPGITRQRSSNSTSSDVTSSFLMRKLAAGNLGRIRTESGCSTISESRGSSRKHPNEEHRISRREYLHRPNTKVVDKSTLKMFDLIYYNPATNPMEQRTPGAVQPVIDPEAETESVAGESGVPETAAESAMPVPQLKLGSNGEMMIDEKSLEIETTAEVEARKVLANSSLIYHDENTGSEGFYRKHKRTRGWLPDETIKFYRCLQTVGTDFSLMLTLFPNRTRRDLKLKFKKEERCNINLINKALLYPGTFNLQDLKEQLEAEEEEGLEQERLWKEIKAKEAKQLKKTNSASSAAARILVPGDEIYQNENITKGKLSKRKATGGASSQPKQKRKTKKSVSLPSRSSNSIDENSLLEKELNDILDPSVVSGDTMDSMSENSSLSEASIAVILNELANGTLAFVSSVDPANPDKAVNEIYILCKETGELSDRPLDLPEEIVDSIRSVMSS